MTEDQKFEEKVQQIEDAMGRLERYKKLGLEIQIQATEELITKLIKELNQRD